MPVNRATWSSDCDYSMHLFSIYVVCWVLLAHVVVNHHVHPWTASTEYSCWYISSCTMNTNLKAWPYQFLLGLWGHCQPWLPLNSLPQGSRKPAQVHISAQPGAIIPCPSDTKAMPPAPAVPGSFIMGHFDATKRRAHNIMGNAPQHGPQHRDYRRHSIRDYEGSVDAFSTFLSWGVSLDLSVSPRSCSDLWHTHPSAISFSGVQVSGL